MHRIRFVVLVGMILAAAASRLIPHPPNFAPIGALALFGGACFTSKRVAFLVPLAAMLLSDLGIGVLSGDLSLGLHALIPVVYGSFALIVCLGFWLSRRRNAVPIAGAALASSVTFFVLTNLGVWSLGSWYSKTWDGLVACYVAASRSSTTPCWATLCMWPCSSAAWLSPRRVGQCCANASSPRPVRSGR